MSLYDLTVRNGTVVTGGRSALQAVLAEGHQRHGLALAPAERSLLTGPAKRQPWPRSTAAQLAPADGAA